MAESPDSTLYLRTLGSVGLFQDAGAVEKHEALLGPGKPLALLLYLLLSRNQVVTRDRLIDLLWSDVDADHGRQTLRQTLWQLRRTLGDDLIVNEHTSIRLNRSINSDYEAFSTAQQRGDHERAVGLYSGPFLPDFAVPGALEFEQWAELERRHLQSAFRNSLVAVVRALLDRGRFGEAIVEAIRLRDDDPAVENGWRLLLEARLAGADLVGARTDADDLERVLAEFDRPPEPSTKRLLARARELLDAPAKEGGGLSGDLVGRESQFARILGAWEKLASAGSSLDIVAPAGLGKTRLLRDVQNRLRARGGRTVYVKAHALEREVPYTFASTLARELSALTGAAGVSPAAAAVLVSLDPALGSTFTASPDRSEGDEALRKRGLALLDLVAATTEASPLAILLDDLHWADAQSSGVLRVLISRIETSSVLVVTARRPGPAIEGTSNSLTLPPLTPLQCRDLLASVGHLSKGAWPDWLVAKLHEAAQGSPLLVLETLQLALDQGWVAVRNGEWAWVSPTSLEEALHAGSALERRIERLTVPEQTALTTLALASGAVDAAILQEVQPSIGPVLASLERGGFARHLGDQWEVSHDEIGTAAINVLAISSRDLRLRLGRALARATGDRDALAKAARHFVVIGAESDLLPLFRAWLKVNDGTRRTDQQLAAELLPGNATWQRKLLRSRPALRRLGFRSPPRAAIAAGILALGFAGYVFAASRGSAEARLSLLVAPLAAQVGLTPPPVVEVQDSRGRRVVDSRDTIRVTLISGGTKLRGTTAVVTDSGRATFEDVSIDQIVGWPVVRFESRGLLPVLDTIRTTVSHLEIMQCVINGAVLVGGHAKVVVRPGTMVNASLHLRYTATWGAAAVMLGLTPTWGEPDRAFVTLGPLNTPAVRAGREVSFSIRGPSTSGTYHVILFFQAEPDVRWIASGTNWSYGHPVWGDGNDVARWTGGQLAEARSLGGVTTNVLRPQGRLAQWVPAAVIDVVVRP